MPLRVMRPSSVWINSMTVPLFVYSIPSMETEPPRKGGELMSAAEKLFWPRIIPRLRKDAVRAPQLPTRAVVGIRHVAGRGRHAPRKVQIIVRNTRDVVARAARVRSGLYVAIGIIRVGGRAGELEAPIRRRCHVCHRPLCPTRCALCVGFQQALLVLQQRSLRSHPQY